MNPSSVMNPSDAITTLLSKMDQGDPDAISELMPLIYARDFVRSRLQRSAVRGAATPCKPVIFCKKFACAS